MGAPSANPGEGQKARNRGKGRGGGRGRGREDKAGRGRGAKADRGKGAADKPQKAKAPPPKAHRRAERPPPKPRRPSPKQLAVEDARAADTAAKAAMAAEAAREKKRLDALAATAKLKADAAQRARDRAADAAKAVADLKTQAALRQEARLMHAPEQLAAARREYREKLRSLKSDLKKCTTLVRKLQIGITHYDAPKLLTDIQGLNLTRYVSELVDAVSETKKTKDKDCAALARVCGALHARHETFASNVSKKLVLVVEERAEDADVSKRQRAALKLLLELVLHGVIDAAIVDPLLRRCCGVGPKGKAKFPVDAPLLGAFLKTGGEKLCGVTPRKTRRLFVEVGEPCPELETTDYAALALDATKRVSHKLLADHGALRSLERKAARDSLNHGSLTEEKEKALEDARKAREKLEKECAVLCDALDIDAPLLLNGEDSEEEDDVGELSLWTAERGSRSEAAGAYDDDAARTFYEDYPNILDVVPTPALGLEPERVAELQAKRESIRALWRGAKTLSGAEAEGLENASQIIAEEDDEPPVELEDDQPRDAVGLLLTEDLPACHSRDRADALAQKFCEGLATGKARKRLVKALYACPRTALDLLPQYSRIAAVVSQAYSDVGELLCSELAREFRWLFRGKKLHNLDGKLRNARFVGELAKFRIAPPHLVFKHCRDCLADFTGHSVDYACSLIETCGGFLLRSAPTKERTARVLQAMTKMKSAKPLNQRDAALVSYACDRANPPERVAVLAKPRTQLYEFTEYLIMVRLHGDDAVEAVIRALRSLPWDEDETCASLIAKFVLKLARSKADAVPLAADCLAGLHAFRPEVTARVLDRILDEFDIGVTAPPSQRPLRTAQRLVAYAALLGECYNFSLVSSQHIFGLVERLLGRGHGVTLGFAAHMAFRAARAAEDARKRIEKKRADALMQERSDEDESEDDLSDDEDPDDAARRAAALYRLDDGALVDPRVPCPGDPPHCFLRITLCCSLLKTAAPCLLASVATHGPLESALDDIQRSFFAKPSAPLGPRYALLDALDDVQRHRAALQASWPRRARVARRRNRPPPPKVPERVFSLRRGWTAADDACRARLAADRALTADRARLALQEAVVQEAVVEGQRRDLADAEDDDEDDEAPTASESESSSESEDDSEEEEEEEAAEEPKVRAGEDAAEDAAEDEDEEDEAAKAPEKSFDDLAFEREFKKSMADDTAAQRRRPASAADSMATPSMLRRFDGQEKARPANPFGGAMNFKLLKRGARGRPEARELHVPEATNFAANVLRNKAARDAEDSSLKAATFQLAKRQEDDDRDPDYDRGGPRRPGPSRRLEDNEIPEEPQQRRHTGPRDADYDPGPTPRRNLGRRW